MICTCTLNPSLDYYMEYDKALSGNAIVNRSQLEYYEAGGKGINVSIVLNNLGIPSRAFGFLGGFTKDFYVSLLAKYEEIRPNFTYINGHTRINVKCLAQEDFTDLHACGPYITNDDMENLKHKVSSLYEGDYFVLAGHSPEYLENDVQEMVEKSIAEGIKVVLDTNPRLMKKLLASKPFMIKTTPDELEVLAEMPCNTPDEIVKAAQSVHASGSRYVMVVESNETAILVCRQGVFRVELTNEEKTIRYVGTGDSLVAGFLMNYLRTKDAVDSFRFGASCGSATAYSKGLATREKIDSFYETTKVERIAE